MFICNTLISSPKQLLRTLLQKSINITKNSTIKDFCEQQHVSPQNQGFVGYQLFPIKRTRDDYPIRYISPIAHRLAAKSTQSAAELSEEIVTQILVYRSQGFKADFHPSLSKKILLELTFQATTAGYIQFEFSDQAIADYLNLLMHSLPSHPEQPLGSWPQLLSAVPHLHPRILRLQHAHARCCSLLRLAHEKHFIQLTSQIPESGVDRWQITTSMPIPWLTATLQFRTDHATELQLIAHIVTALDTLTDWHSDCPSASTLPASTVKSVITLLTAAEELSQAFHASHQHWQLMGNLRNQGRDRLQTHLGLILITQRLLYQLLQNQLGIEVPFEL